MQFDKQQIIKDVLERPTDFALYGTGSLNFYEQNKLLFGESLKFVAVESLLSRDVGISNNSIVVLFTPFDLGLKERVLNSGYLAIELHEFIDYKANLFWNQKGEYKGVDRNHYMSNEIVLQELARNKDPLEFIPANKKLSILSLGCGTGNLERRLLSELNLIEHIHAIDISEDSIRTAEAKLNANSKKDLVSYEVANLNSASFEQNKYDVVIAQECIHHIQNLESLYANINSALKPDGVFIQTEYVGPNRFQFERSILLTVNTILKLLPAKFKNSPKYEKVRKIDIIQADPSEAVRSQEIIPLTKRFFPNSLVFFNTGTLIHILHQKLNMDYFYTEQSQPADNFKRSRWLVKLVFFIEKVFWGARYGHMAMLVSHKK